MSTCFCLALLQEFTRTIRVANKNPTVKSLFAEFGVRMFALPLDLFAVLYLTLAIETHVLSVIGLTMPDGRIGPFLVFVLYFGAFWASPLRATPAQLLLGLRVVDFAGERLTFQWAFVRSVALVLLIVGIYFLFEIPARPLTVAVGIVALAAVFLAAVTPNRQAAHDVLARSIVVNAKSLRASDRRNKLLRHVVNEERTAFGQRRPSIWSIMIDGAVLAFPVFLMTIVAQTQHDRDRFARTSYASSQTNSLRTAVIAYYVERGEWPDNDADLGVETRAEYPDGGYYELENNGVIRIRFTVLPDLVTGSILQTPSVGEDGAIWGCRVDGELALSHVPAICRD